MGHIRSLKSGKKVLVLSKEDKRKHQERRLLHWCGNWQQRNKVLFTGYCPNPHMAMNRHNLRELTAAFFRMQNPVQECSLWVSDRETLLADMRKRMHATLKAQHTSVWTRDCFASGDVNYVRRMMVDVDNELRMARWVLKALTYKI